MPRTVYAASCSTGATASLTKNASGSMGKVTSLALPGLCWRAISSARSMLSACIATLNRADPLLTWTEILIISPYLPSKKIETIVAYELYVTVLTVSSENMLETVEFWPAATLRGRRKCLGRGHTAPPLGKACGAAD